MVLYILKFKGDPDELLSRFEKADPRVWKIVDDHGFVGETVGRTDDGIIIAEIWKSHEGFQAGIGDPFVSKQFEELGFTNPELEGPFEVVRDYQPGR